MNANEYQALALRTASPTLTPEIEEILDLIDPSAACRIRHKFQLSIAGHGLAGEAGEVAEHIKKHLGHGQPLDTEKLKKEIGDVLWYIALLCAQLRMDMGAVMQANIDKLRERWPDGFDATKPQAAGDLEDTKHGPLPSDLEKAGFLTPAPAQKKMREGVERALFPGRFNDDGSRRRPWQYEIAGADVARGFDYTLLTEAKKGQLPREFHVGERVTCQGYIHGFGINGDGELQVEVVFDGDDDNKTPLYLDAISPAVKTQQPPAAAGDLEDKGTTVPRIPAAAEQKDNGQWILHFTCPYCKEIHRHGGGRDAQPHYGYKVSHCDHVSTYELIPERPEHLNAAAKEGSKS